jgi:hypothetical protein
MVALFKVSSCCLGDIHSDIAFIPVHQGNTLKFSMGIFEGKSFWLEWEELKTALQISERDSRL